MRLDPLLWMVFALLLVLRAPQMVAGDADLATHIAYGQVVLQGLPSTEPLIWGTTGELILHEWLFEACVAVLDRLLGLTGPLLFGVGLVATTVVAVRRSCGTAFWPALLTTLLTWLCLETHLTTRPHVVSWLLLVVLHHLLRTQAAGWVLVPLFALWANLHGGFVLGLGLVGLYSLSQRRWWLPVLCGGATLLNPWGLRLHTHLLGFLGNDWVLAGTSDFQPPTFAGGTLLPVVIWGLVLIGLCLRRRTLTWVEGVLIVGTFAAALTSVRNVPLLGLLLAPVVAAWMTEVQPESLAESSTRLGREFLGSDTLLWGVVAIPVLVAFLMGAQMRGPHVPTADLTTLRGRGLTEFAWGGYLLYLAPQAQPQIHPLNANYPPKLLKRTERFLHGTGLPPRGVDWVLIHPDRPVNEALRGSPCWTLAGGAWHRSDACRQP